MYQGQGPSLATSIQTFLHQRFAETCETLESTLRFCNQTLDNSSGIESYGDVNLLAKYLPEVLII